MQTYRVAMQEALSAVEYADLMMDRIDEILESRFRALREIEKEKLKVARVYNKRVGGKSFPVGELVWKTILPVGTQNNKFGK
jgi:hypothetical protein